MKKLLALILCVMMFVSVVPTSAFAASVEKIPVDVALNTVSSYNTQIKNMIKNTKSSVEKAYKTLVGDQVVYASAKTMDDTIVSLVDAITDPLIEKGDVNKAFADNVKDAIRSYFDATVAKKIDDNAYKAYNRETGARDDLKYAQVVADAISAAMTDKKFIAGYQAVATYWALAKIVDDINDELEDKYDDFYDSIDPSLQKTFNDKYTTLVDSYIDTLQTAAAKEVNIALAGEVYDAFRSAALTTYDATVAAAAATETGKVKKAEDDLKTAKENANKPVEQAEDTLVKAQIALEKVELNPKSTAQEIADAAKAVADATKAYGEAKEKANKDIAAAQKKYDDAVTAADVDYDLAVFQAGVDYDTAMKQPTKDYTKVINDNEIFSWGFERGAVVGSWA